MLKLIAHLRCLETGSKLTLMEDNELARLNRAIEEGKVFNRLGQRVNEKLDAALVNDDQTLAYAVFDQIPQLIFDEAISLTGFKNRKAEK